jgi:hypothetical protein
VPPRSPVTRGISSGCWNTSALSILAHDQAYALLGLCDPRDLPGNPVRYDLEPEDAYEACVVSHAYVHGSLDSLGLCTPVQRDVLTRGPFAGPT